ncbi:hypothetical protein OQI87_00975 [Lactobacillus kefiranofaciens]|uniref:phage tail spike protein n=1 Tax=Lactobacillus kefiranofaciens TaxID=267818 RepID=UPI00246966D5|nr:phage tail spike protein [Lactobacillus kefiranofaciens]MDH5099747.1 hypothetical protein [Lactobacillus kefiranofaciens]
MAKITVGTIPEIDYGEYEGYEKIPHLYNSLTDDLTTAGYPLPDVITCQVSGNRNQYKTLQITYPADGVNADKLAENKYIMEDSDAKFLHQLFKITHIQQELDNIVVDAEHISATLNDAIIADPLQLVNASPQDLMNQVLNTMQPQKDFTFDSDVMRQSNVNLEAGKSVGSIITDPDQEGDEATQSLLGLFGGELEFDNFRIHHTLQAGKDSGIVVNSKNITSLNHDRSTESMFTGAVFVASYTPGQAIAKEDWSGWSSWQSNYNSVGITYMAGGSVNIYDSPVEGQKIIRTITNGQKLRLGTIVNDGSFTPDGKYQINTVNSAGWYPIDPADGGGWIESSWLTFDQTGAYAINPITGHIEVQASDPHDESGAGSRVSISGSAVVTYRNGGSIHVYESPDIGPGHIKVPGWTVKNGTVIDYDMVERNQKGDMWYRIGPGQWLYGPHLSLSQEGSYQSFSNYGYGYVKDDAIKYHLNKDHQMVATTRTVDKAGSKSKRSKNYWKTKRKKVKVRAKKGMTQINRTITQGGVTYQHTKYGWVKSSSISYKKDGSVKPQTSSSYLKNRVKDHSKVEIYATPNAHDALNWSIPSGTSLDVANYEAKGGDGKTYVQVTYAGKTGWLPEDSIDDKKSQLHAPDAGDDTDTDSNAKANVDQSQKTVRVVVGPMYADGFGINPDIDKVAYVDVSDLFTHDDQDLSGQQSDGSFAPTQKDIDQVTEIGGQYLIEHRFGHPQISTTIGYQEMSGINADFQQLSLYDYLYVKYDKYNLSERVQVNGYVWDCLAHRYISLTLGNLPVSWLHLLQKKIDQKSNERISRVTGQVNQVGGFVGAVNQALKLQGSAQTQAWENLMVQLGDADYKTDKHGKKHLQLNESVKKFAKHMTDMKDNIDNFNSYLETGPRGTLEFVDDTGNQNMQSPTEIRAYNGSTYFSLNNNGISFKDSQQNTHALFGVDDYTGKITGNFFVDEAHIPVIDASHIQCDTIHALGTIYGDLEVTATGITTHIGNFTNIISGDSDGGIKLSSENYESQVTSGAFNCHDKSNGSMGHYGPNQAVIGGRAVMVTSSGTNIMGDWIKEYWRGPSKYWNL